jgi:hypothetical protein
MARVALLVSILLTALTWNHVAQADWKKLLEQTLDSDTAKNATSAALSNDDVIAGLKEALAKGAESAVNALGQTDGFLGNSAVRIPLPEKLKPISKVLKAVGQSRYSDEFVQTMNRAAESAVPEASAILGDAIRQMSVEDARKILNGPDDAATQYFRKVGEDRLTTRLRPIVSDATSRAGVTSSYKQLVDSAGSAAQFVNTDSLDLDGYVTGKALDGLFLFIAAEEKRIRENPAARTTDLLKKVFSK